MISEEDLRDLIGNYLMLNTTIEVKEVVDFEEELAKAIMDEIAQLEQENTALKKQLEGIRIENVNLISVIYETIQRYFIDYDKLPKAKDVMGILKGKDSK